MVFKNFYSFCLFLKKSEKHLLKYHSYDEICKAIKLLEEKHKTDLTNKRYINKLKFLVFAKTLIKEFYPDYVENPDRYFSFFMDLDYADVFNINLNIDDYDNYKLYYFYMNHCANPNLHISKLIKDSYYFSDTDSFEDIKKIMLRAKEKKESLRKLFYSLKNPKTDRNIIFDLYLKNYKISKYYIDKSGNLLWKDILKNLKLYKVDTDSCSNIINSEGHGRDFSWWVDTYTENVSFYASPDFKIEKRIYTTLELAKLAKEKKIYIKSIGMSDNKNDKIIKEYSEKLKNKKIVSLSEYVLKDLRILSYGYDIETLHKIINQQFDDHQKEILYNYVLKGIDIQFVEKDYNDFINKYNKLKSDAIKILNEKIGRNIDIINERIKNNNDIIETKNLID